MGTSLLTRPAVLAVLPIMIATLAGPVSAAPQQLDPTFSDGERFNTGVVTTEFPGFDAAARDVAVQPDGKIVAVGHAQVGERDCYGRPIGFAVVRYHRYGSLDTGFSDNGRSSYPLGGRTEHRCGDGITQTTLVDARAETVALQPDGAILVGGHAVSGYSTQAALARHHANGSLDRTFGDAGTLILPAFPADEMYNENYSAVHDISVLPDGRIVLAAVTTGLDRANDAARVAYLLVRRLHPSGALDTSFGDSGTMTLTLDPEVVSHTGERLDQHLALEVDSSGRTLVTVPTHGELAVARLSADGDLDLTFGQHGRASIAAGGTVSSGTLTGSAADLALQPDGKIVVGGRSNYLDGVKVPHTDFALARFNSDGTVDSSFGDAGRVITDAGIGAYDEVSALALDPVGRIVATGPVTSGKSWGVTRYLPDGSIDTDFTGGRTILEPDLNRKVNVETAHGLALQPDGKVLIVGTAPVEDNTGNGQFLVARLRPGHDTPLPENGAIVFQRSMPDANTSVDVLAVSPDGHDTANLTQTPTVGDTWNIEAHPSWSPEGSRVAYFFAGKPDASDSGLYTMDAHGGDRTKVVGFEETGIIYHTAWSADGKHLAYGSMLGGRDDISVVRADGTGRVTLTGGPAFADLDFIGYPDFSPDGTRIAFSASRDGVMQVFTMSRSGDGLVQVTHGDRPSVDPAWSPDGSQIVFSSNRDNAADCLGCHDLYVANADGSDTAKILDTGDDDISPSWSPDGSRIVFVRHVASGPVTVHTADPDGTDLAELVAGEDPDWQPVVYPGDTDGIPDWADNCQYDNNPSQADANDDGTGDACTYAEPDPDPVDAVAPTVTGQAPVSGATTVAPGTNVTVDFSEALAPASVDTATVSLKQGTRAVQATVRLDAVGTRAILDPASDLTLGAMYTVTVKGGTAGVTDVAGNPLAQNQHWSFRVNTPPSVTSVSPAAGATTRDRTPLIKATVTDAESKLKASDIVVKVDGKTKSFSYERGTVKLVAALKRGKHTISVVATDPQKLAATKAWNFTIK